jgi:nicotinamidase/pyrazinamidase
MSLSHLNKEDSIMKINRHKTASFDVDAQKGFTPLCPDELPVPGGHTLAEELNRQAGFARLRVGSKDAHPHNPVWKAGEGGPMFSPVEGKHVDIRWNLHCVAGTRGHQLIDGLPHPADYDFFVQKGIEPDMHPYGACYHDLAERQSTGVIEYLKCNEIDTVIVGGIATDYCVKTTAMQLCRAGFRVVVNLAACRGIAEETVSAAIEEMKESGIIVVERLEAD